MTNYTYTATLVSPLHHGAGTAGNTSLLRREDVITPEGRTHQVPFVSGNSMRHMLRSTLAWHAAKTLEIEPGSLPKVTVDLLWSGGAVTSTGAQVNLQQARNAESYFPALGLFGFAAQSDIVAGTLRVSHLSLVCAENKWRARLGGHKFFDVPSARFTGEEFGTRHDVSGTAVDVFTQAADKATQTTQMIYDMQILKPGAVLQGLLSTHDGITTKQEHVLRAVMTLAAPGGRAMLAAKNAVGFGEVIIEGWPTDLEAVEWWESELRANKTEILSLLEAMR